LKEIDAKTFAAYFVAQFSSDGRKFHSRCQHVVLQYGWWIYYVAPFVGAGHATGTCKLLFEDDCDDNDDKAEHKNRKQTRMLGKLEETLVQRRQYE
jgi:hypothetical protein